MSSAEKKRNKLAVLEVVKKYKDILFAPGNTVSKLEKQSCWEEVLNTAQAVGLANANRNWYYARDHIFGQWKNRTLVKRESAFQNAGYGKAINFNIIDKAILEILGADAPIMEIKSSNGIYHSNNQALDVTSNVSMPASDYEEEQGSSQPLPSEDAYYAAKRKYQDSNGTYEYPQKKSRVENLLNQSNDENTSIEVLRKKILETELYKNKLEIYKLEKELGLTASKFTEQFHTNSNSGNLSSAVKSEPADFI